MKSKVQEIIILRSIACLTVVFIHAITRSPSTFDSVNKMDIVFSYLQLLLMYGTPMFVFISEFVLAYNYKDRIPDKFISKRIKFILLPLYVWVFFMLDFQSMQMEFKQQQYKVYEIFFRRLSWVFYLNYIPVLLSPYDF